MQVNICLFSMFLSSKYVFLPQKGSLPFMPPRVTKAQAWDLLSQDSAEPIPVITGHPPMNPKLRQIRALQHSVMFSIRVYMCVSIYKINLCLLSEYSMCTRQVNTGKNATPFMFRACACHGQ